MARSRSKRAQDDDATDADGKRKIWSGSISFGLVQIPVGLHSAEATSDTLRLTLLDERDHAPIGYRHVNKVTGEEVPKDRRVKGYEVAKDEYVILTDEDFKRANVEATETIDIRRFVDLGDVPLLRFERPYYLSPTKRGLKAYVLLRDALRRTNKVAIATIVLRQRQHLCALLPFEDALVLELLRYDHEIVPVDEAGVAPAMDDVELSPAEIDMAETLIEGMTGPFDTRDIKDTYRDDLLAVIEERRAHPERAPEPPRREKEKEGRVVDIMSLLKQSVERQRALASEKPSRATRPERSSEDAEGDAGRDRAKAGTAAPARASARRKPARPGGRSTSSSARG